MGEEGVGLGWFRYFEIFWTKPLWKLSPRPRLISTQHLLKETIKGANYLLLPTFGKPANIKDQTKIE